MGFPRILVKAPNWIGDAVLAGPLLGALRANWRKAHIAVLAREKVRPVIERLPGADETVAEEAMGIRALAGWIQANAFDALVLLSSGLAVPLACAYARVPLRIGFRGSGRSLLLTRGPAPLPRSLHQVEHYLALGSVLGAFRPARPRLFWRVKEADRAEAGALIKAAGKPGGAPLVALAPGGAFGPAKRWFRHRWAGLADRLSLEMDCRVAIVGGAAEAGEAEAIAELTARAPINAAGRLTLGGTAALLARCRAFVSNDSGLLHAGAAVGTPTLGLFGSSNPHWTGPYGPNCRALWGRVPCSPCYRRSCLPGRDYACLDALSVELVWRELKGVLDVGGKRRGP